MIAKLNANDAFERIAKELENHGIKPSRDWEPGDLARDFYKDGMNCSEVVGLSPDEIDIKAAIYCDAYTYMEPVAEQDFSMEGQECQINHYNSYTDTFGRYTQEYMVECKDHIRLSYIKSRGLEDGVRDVLNMLQRNASKARRFAEKALADAELFK